MRNLKYSVLIIVVMLINFGCDNSVFEFQPKSTKVRLDKKKFKIDTDFLKKQQEKIDEIFKVEYKPLTYRSDRDPFYSVIDLYKTEVETEETGNPLLSVSLDQIKLVGILKSSFGNVGVLDINGGTYYVKQGDVIGVNKGKVVSITDDMLVVRQVEKDIFGNVKTDIKEIYLTQKEGK